MYNIKIPYIYQYIYIYTYRRFYIYTFAHKCQGNYRRCRSRKPGDRGKLMQLYRNMCCISLSQTQLAVPQTAAARTIQNVIPKPIPISWLWNQIQWLKSQISWSEISCRGQALSLLVRTRAHIYIYIYIFILIYISYTYILIYI